MAARYPAESREHTMIVLSRQRQALTAPGLESNDRFIFAVGGVYRP